MSDGMNGGRTTVEEHYDNTCPVCGCRESIGMRGVSGERMVVCQECGVPLVEWERGMEVDDAS